MQGTQGVKYDTIVSVQATWTGLEYSFTKNIEAR